jgi:hypothetical protein
MGQNKVNAWAALILSLAIIFVFSGLSASSVPEILCAIVFMMIADFIKKYWK